jgi:hypothetical protein
MLLTIFKMMLNAGRCSVLPSSTVFGVHRVQVGSILAFVLELHKLEASSCGTLSCFVKVDFLDFCRIPFL